MYARELSCNEGSVEVRDLILVDVETAELLLLPLSGDGERARDELVDESSHHFFFVPPKL